jgi:holin-like protein
MKFMRQLGIILLISACGELLRAVIPLPIPAGIYGFAIMLLCLCTGVVKLHQVEAAGDMLVDIMQVLLIPSCVALMTYWRELSGSLPVLIGASVISTALVLVATGKAADAAIDLKERRGK